MFDNPYFPYLHTVADVLAAAYCARLFLQAEGTDRKIITALLTAMWILLAAFLVARWPVWH